MAKKLINLGASPNDNTGDSLRAGGSIINSNFNELYAAKANLENNVAGKTDKGGYPGTSQDLKNYVDALSFDGAITYDTVSDLPTPVPSEGTTAKVGNDPDPDNNGDWYVSGGSWVQVARNNTIDDIFGLPEKLSIAKVATTSDKLCAYGMDSLTDGAGGFSYREFFDPIWRGAFKSAEVGFVWLNLADMNNVGASFGTNLTVMIDKPDFSIAPIKYSLCGKGLYQLSGSGGYIDVDTQDKFFERYRLYYLQQPGGGTFKAGFSNSTTGSLIDVDTDGDLSIQYVEVQRPLGRSFTLAVREVTGNCAFFCVRYMLEDDNASTLNLGTGGMKLEKINTLDRSFRQQWYSLLKPAVLLLNAGANDQGTATKADFKGWLSDYVEDVQVGYPQCNVVIVQPNQTSAWGTTNAPEHYEARKEVAIEKNVDFFDTIKVVGDYAYFVGNSMMLDGTHPNKKGYEILTEHYLKFLRIQNYGNFLPMPTIQGNSEVVTRLSGDIPIYSGGSLSANTTRDAYKFGMYSAFSLLFVEITAVFRLEGSSNNVVKRIKFSMTSNNVYGSVVNVGDLIIDDVYRKPSTGGTVPVPNITLSVIDNRALLSYSAQVNLASVSMSGKWQLGQSVDTDLEILFSDI